MENKIESIFAIVNELFQSTSKREILIAITSDEFLILFGLMKDYKRLDNANNRAMSGIHGNVTTFTMNGNFLHFKIY